MTINKLTLLALFNFAFIGLAYSQSNPYKFSDSIEVNKSKAPVGFNLQLAATDYAFQGNFLSALKTWNQQRPNIKAIPFNASDSIFYKNSSVSPAKPYVIERSKKEDILILNELHHNPSHRVFAASLLKDLYANGYRYLGLEALLDTAINSRGFVVQESGFYTAEPEFANFVNEALALGFKVFGYEVTPEAKFDADQWKNREIAQAHNINNFMKNNKEGKYFIYCGAGHAFEGNNNGRGLSMAGVLADLTKINPFTIDQNRYSYKGEMRYNSPLSILIDADEPVILKNQSGEVFRSSAPSYETDISIIQPVSMFEGKSFEEKNKAKGSKVNGTELNNYQVNSNYFKALKINRKTFKIDVSKIKTFPAIIKYFNEKDYKINPQAVPVGVLEVKSNADNNLLLLKPGSYKTIIN